jgi:hypothetical protein
MIRDYAGPKGGPIFDGRHNVHYCALAGLARSRSTYHVIAIWVVVFRFCVPIQPVVAADPHPYGRIRAVTSPIQEDDDAITANSWPLVRVFDVVALVFLSVVVARAIGGVVAAFGVPSISTPTGVVESGFSLPTYFRLQTGTGWADIDSGLLLLGCVGLLALPRMVREVAPKDQGSQTSLVLLVADGVVAATAVVAGVIAIVNLLWNEPGGVNYNEAVNVAEYVGASALAALAVTLCWFARPIVAMESES